jgi:hypothetical protein
MEGFFIFSNTNYKPLLLFKPFTRLPLTTSHTLFTHTALLLAYPRKTNTHEQRSVTRLRQKTKAAYTASGYLCIHTGSMFNYQTYKSLIMLTIILFAAGLICFWLFFKSIDWFEKI